MIHWRLSRAVTLAAAAAAVGLAAAPATAATSGTFTATGSMHVAHTQGIATLLPDGQVLVTGANSGGGAALPSPELYNPATGTWSVTGQMNTPRIDATATLLPDGQVLVAGGSGGGSNALASAELYNPATGTWSVTGSMHQGRSGLNGARASATLLPDGEVLIAGGEDANFNLLSSAELYNPATGKFTPTGSMTTARVGQSATLLNNGQVLMAGGTGATAAAELYNPATGKFTATGSMSGPRGGNVGTLLPDGDVLVTGRAQTFAELYHPATGQWSNASAGLPVCISTMECQALQHRHAATHRQRPGRRRARRSGLEPANHRDRHAVPPGHQHLDQHRQHDHGTRKPDRDPAPGRPGPHRRRDALRPPPCPPIPRQRRTLHPVDPALPDPARRRGTGQPAALIRCCGVNHRVV